MATPEPVFLQVTGSTSMAPLLSDLAAAFSEQQSTPIGLEIAGLGTRFGLEQLRSGEADLAMASWLVLGGSGSESDGDREVLEGLRTNPGWRATAMARDGIAIIVHRSNPLQGLGLLQLQDLFGGRLHAWSDVGAESAPGQVELVSRELGSGTRAAFEVLVMADRRVSPSAVVASSSSQVVAYVAEHPFAVGYVSMAHVSSEVKVLRIEGELPTPETTGQGSYPLSREWWLVSADPPGQGVQDLIDFCLSPAGQQIVGRRLGRVR